MNSEIWGTKPRPKLGLMIAIIVLGALLGTALRHRLSHPDQTAPAEITSTAMAGQPPPQPVNQPQPSMATPPKGSRTSASASNGVARASHNPPWWSALSESEAAIRRSDYTQLWDLPGLYPEFSEISRTLQYLGIPQEIAELESREIYQVLWDRMNFDRLAVEQDNLPLAGTNANDPARQGPAPGTLAMKAVAARTELRQRLTALGLDLESEQVDRILQLQPRTPLPALGTGGSASTVLGSATAGPLPHSP
jgi:hypothetical protein